MNLGLLDILTVQQVDSPAYKKPEAVKARGEAVASEGQRAVSKSEKTFEEYVNNLNPKQASQEAFDNPVYGNLLNNEVGLGVNGEGLGNNNLNVADGLKANVAILGAVEDTGKGVEGLSQGLGLKGLFNALQALKDSGFPIPPNSPIAGLLSLKNSGDISFDASNSLQGVAGGTLLDLVKQVANGNFQVDLDGIEGVKNLDEVVGLIKDIASKVADNIKNTVDVENSLGDAVKKAADGIIQASKNDAQTPELDGVDIKSDQVISLLKGVKNSTFVDEKQSQSQKDGNIPLAGLKIDSEKLENKKVDNQLASKIENKEILNNKLAQIENAAGNSAAKNAAANQSPSGQNNNNSDDSGFSRSGDIFTKTSLQSNPEVGNNQEFVKFQKYLEAAQVANGADKASRSTSSENVMAQIKFGMSAVAGKNNGNITIQLHPKELGSVDVRMEMGNDGKTRVAIIAEKVDTMNLLQKDSGMLKDMLQDALKTESTNLSFSFHSNGDEGWKEFLNNGSGGQGHMASSEESVDPELASGYQYQQNLVASGGLDIRV